MSLSGWTPAERRYIYDHQQPSLPARIHQVAGERLTALEGTTTLTGGVTIVWKAALTACPAFSPRIYTVHVLMMSSALDTAVSRPILPLACCHLYTAVRRIPGKC